ncbi:MAG: PD40 domain-containing protein [Gemmatimonadota bacterium]|nr:MAG: PD40 domain-containing protein [Gemmatimonadota bacterium]
MFEPKSAIAMRSLLIVAGATLGCTADGTEPTVGPVDVMIVTSTYGIPPDPDGYRVNLGGRSAELETTDTVAFEVTGGDYIVELADLAANCSVQGTNPRTVTLHPETSPYLLTFAVACFGAERLQDQIVFLSDRLQRFSNHLFVMDSDGSNVARLSMDLAGVADVSPDGRRIATASCGGLTTTISLMNADGSGRAPIANIASPSCEPSWAPDGLKIVFTVGFPDRALWTIGIDGFDQTRLTDEPGFYSGPDWSPDGTKIAFARIVGAVGGIQIFAMAADGSNLTQLTSIANGSATRPVWSPDGTKIAFTSDRDGNLEVYVMNTDGTDLTNLTNHPSDDYAAVWSWDGTMIAFTTTRDGNEEIYLMNVDGTGLVNLTTNPADDCCPAWSP